MLVGITGRNMTGRHRRTGTASCYIIILVEGQSRLLGTHRAGVRFRVSAAAYLNNNLLIS